MKPIREVYPDTGYGYFSVGDYNPLLESFGYEILLHVDDDDYQGDSLLLFRDGERYGILIFGWGSCSGCDALQACSNYEEVEELRTSLHEQIRWGTKDQILWYFQNHDWKGDWMWHAKEGQKFITEAIKLLLGGESS